MHKTLIDPPALPQPFGNYAHGLKLTDVNSMVRSSGQLSIDQNGDIPPSPYDQATMIFGHLLEILKEGQMTPDNIVHIGAYVTDRGYMADYMKARDEFLAGCQTPPPASTLLIVSGFTKPEFKVEIEITAMA